MCVERHRSGLFHFGASCFPCGVFTFGPFSKSSEKKVCTRAEFRFAGSVSKHRQESKKSTKSVRKKHARNESLVSCWRRAYFRTKEEDLTHSRRGAVSKMDIETKFVCIFRVAPGIFFAFRLGKMRIRLVSCVLRRFKRCGSFDVWNKAAARDA